MATAGRGREDREARERARVYAARQQLHSDQGRRRRRDNLLAGVIGGLVILGAIGAQTLYFTTGPGAPEPAPTSSTGPSPSGSPDPLPTESAPVPTPTDPASDPSPTTTP